MLKELQKQIKEQKEQTLQPLIDKISKVYEGFQVAAEINDDLTEIEVNLSTRSMLKQTKISFIFSEKDQVFSAESLEYYADESGMIIGVKSIPLSISYQLIHYTFSSIAELLESLAANKEEETGE